MIAKVLFAEQLKRYCGGRNIVPKEWFVKTNDQIEGPFASSQLKQLADTGKVTPTHLVCQGAEGTPGEKWAQAAKVKGLFASRGAAEQEAATKPQGTAETPAQATESKPTPAPPPTKNPSDENWHTALDGQQAGPFTLADLLQQPFPNGTLVWHPSLTGWTVPAEVEELKPHVAHSPPPLPPKNAISQSTMPRESSSPLEPSLSKQILNDPQLKKRAEKIVLSQDRDRDSAEGTFSDGRTYETCFETNEYLLRSIFGPEHYYILTTRRILIGEISVEPFPEWFAEMEEINAIGEFDFLKPRAFDLSDVTRTTRWSEPYSWCDGPSLCMNMQMWTLNGDIDICAWAVDPGGRPYKPPYGFDQLVSETVQHVENDTVCDEAQLYFAAKEAGLGEYKLRMSLIEDVLVYVRDEAAEDESVEIEPLEDKDGTPLAKQDNMRGVIVAGPVLCCAYPFSDEPMLTLHKLGIELPSGVTSAEWDANLCVNFELGFDNIPALSRFVHQYMVRALELPDEQSVVFVNSF